MEAASPKGPDKSRGGGDRAGVATAIAEAEIRQGSPFAPGTATAADQPRRVHVDAGAASEVARGGVWAAWLILPFATATAWIFPLGGVLIAGLGVMLSLMGLNAPRPVWAVAALAGHILLLAISLLPVL